MPTKIVPIVEGHGDVAAVPVLLRRIAERLEVYDAQIGKPIRCQRHKLVLGCVSSRYKNMLKTEGNVALFTNAN